MITMKIHLLENVFNWHLIADTVKQMPFTGSLATKVEGFQSGLWQDKLLKRGEVVCDGGYFWRYLGLNKIH